MSLTVFGQLFVVVLEIHCRREVMREKGLPVEFFRRDPDQWILAWKCLREIYRELLHLLYIYSKIITQKQNKEIDYIIKSRNVFLC
jgi:hypothetical protein